MRTTRSFFELSWLQATYVLRSFVRAGRCIDHLTNSMYLLHFCSINLGCVTPLGLENGAISDTQIAASSQLDSTHSAKQARLHSKADGSKWGSWSALTNDLSQWLQVDLSTYTRVTRLATQGRNGFYQWVTKYNLQYSDDGDAFHSFGEPGTNRAKVYPN